MTILFRVDAGKKIGLGHYYRSLNLAQVLKDRGHEVLFMHLSSDFWNKLNAFPFRHIPLTNGEEETQMLYHCKKTGASVFYVDGIISFRKSFLTEIKKLAKVVFYQNLTEYRYLADIYILPSIHQNDAFFEPFEKSGTTVYKGLEYFTFNKEIEKIAPKELSNDSSVKNAAITAGGSDPANILISLYNMLDDGILNRTAFTFFYGQDYAHKEKIPTVLKKNTSFRLYNMAEIMKHDVLIAAFGVSAYEFMYLGLPVIGLGHQPSNADALRIFAKQTNAIYDLGLFDDITDTFFLTTLSQLFSNGELLVSMAKTAHNILDLQGVERVAYILEGAI